ncbi:MAG: thiol reductant ABC exporter subunit CydC [Gammaproteobacteria bacterium]|nr:thiol reductant ABC exporter subunit CydC [Gammaproteobacteria bacterium]
MSHWQVVLRLLAFMKPLNGIMVVSTVARAIKLLMRVALIAAAAGGVALYVAAPGAATLWEIGRTLVVCAFVLGLFSYIETYTGHYVAFRLLAMLRNEFYDRMEPLAPAGTAELRTGDAVSRVINDCERVEPFYAHTIAPAICALVVPAIVLWYLANYQHPAFAWTLAPFLGFMVFVLPLITAFLGAQGGEEWRAKQGQVNAFLTDSLQGIRDTVAFGFGERRRQQAWQLGVELKRGQDRLTRADAFQRGCTEFVVGAAAVAMVWVSWPLVQAGVIDPLRTVPVVVAVALTSFYATIGLNNVVNDYRVAIVSARRLWELMDQRPAVADTAAESPSGVEPAIALREVSFAYKPGARPVLDGISVDIRPGQHVAIVGSSGAGKSTIANLLLRFWDPLRGEVAIGGIDVRRFRLDDLRDMIAVVSQRNYIFNTTIGDNIRMGRPGASQAEVEAAARRANLAGWIASLPAGYDTPVGEMGSKVSGGQRQRIAIARALLKDAPILILDEATSNLDVETEREVNAAIGELAKGRTVLTIAHRLSTVRTASEILVLESGRVAERGTHEELLRRNGVYTRLFELQQDEVDARLDEATPA